MILLYSLEKFDFVDYPDYASISLTIFVLKLLSQYLEKVLFQLIF